MQNQPGEQLFNVVKHKKHIIWDWNGTLLNDVDHAVQTVNTLLAEHKLPLVNRERYRQIFDFPVIEYYRKLGFDFGQESFESLCEKFVDRFMAGVPSLPLIPQMKSVLTHLHQNKYKQSVLSATDQKNLDSMMKHYELESVFDFVFGIDNKLADSKIHRGHELIRISEVSLSETVIIGDTLHDLEVAHALGIDAVLISHGHQCPTRLRLHHDQIVDVVSR